MDISVVKESLDETLASFNDSRILQTYSNAFHVKKGLIFDIIYNIIKEGRRLNSNLYQSFQFYLTANLFYFTIQLFGNLLLLPPIFSGIQSLWVNF
jgi:hypothetical protein